MVVLKNYGHLKKFACPYIKKDKKMKFKKIILVMMFVNHFLFSQTNVNKLEKKLKNKKLNFNPKISLNGLLTGAYSAFEHIENPYEEPEEGINIQEIELRFSADVDTYFRADATVAYESQFEVEEVYVETLSFIKYFHIKFGKFKQPFGKLNLLHTHALPFIDRNFVNSELLGEEGLNEIALEMSVLFPLSWYSELTVSGSKGENESIFIVNANQSKRKEDFGYLTHWKNLIDLRDDLTMELGLSYLVGKNNHEGNPLTHVGGGDLTFKWVSSRNNSSLIWQTEYIFKVIKNKMNDEEMGGIYSIFQHRFAKRWWWAYRFEFLGLPSDAEKLQGHTAMIAFVPSEFSSFRLQYNLASEKNQWTDKILFQVNFSIGAHPAHTY